MAYSFLPSLNYPGSYEAGGSIGMGYRNFSGPDYGVYDANTGKVISLQTRQPWNGKEPRTGKIYKNGTESGTGDTVQVPGTDEWISPSDWKKRYEAVAVTKDADALAASKDLMGQLQTSIKNSTTGFDDYKKKYQAATDSAFEQGKAATDIGGLTDTLRRQQTQYATSLGTAGADYAALNASDAAAQRALVAQGYDYLPMFDTAKQNIADQNYAMADAARKKYVMSRGGGLGGDELAIVGRNINAAYLPLEEAKINKRYDLLQNLSLPVQRDLAAQERLRISQFEPQTAQQIYSSGHETELAIQNLKDKVSSMSYENATRYMQSLGVPYAVQQQILSGQAATLAGLEQINQGAQYQGLMDRLGVQQAQPIYYSTSQPSLPSGGTRTGGYGLGGYGLGGAAAASGGGVASVTPTTYTDSYGQTQTSYPGSRTPASFTDQYGNQQWSDITTGGVRYYNPYT